MSFSLTLPTCLSRNRGFPCISEPRNGARFTSKGVNKRLMRKLRKTFLECLSDIYDAEKQLLKALPKMSQAAKNESLKAGFEQHLNETKGHVQRIEQVFESLGEE